MITFENTIEIEQPVADVFAFTANFENVPKWNYYVRTVRQISGRQPQAGAIYHQIRHQDEQTYQITDFMPNQRLTVMTIPGSQPVFQRELRFQPIGQGTRITDRWQLDLGTHFLIERLAQGRVKAAVAENLGKLKELLETGKTLLQDGRSVTLSTH
jgi:uncharacterized membrane protein